MTLMLKDNHYEFILNELGIDRTKFDMLNESEKGDLYDKILDIELSETPCSKHPDILTSRGETAIEIVNIMAKALGYMPENIEKEWETEMAD